MQKGLAPKCQCCQSRQGSSSLMANGRHGPKAGSSWGTKRVASSERQAMTTLQSTVLQTLASTPELAWPRWRLRKTLRKASWEWNSTVFVGLERRREDGAVGPLAWTLLSFSTSFRAELWT